MDKKEPEWILREQQLSESFDLGNTRQAEISAWGMGKSLRSENKVLPLIRKKKKYKQNSLTLGKQDSFSLSPGKGKRGGAKFVLRKFSPSAKLCQEIRACLKQPNLPQRDISKYRKDIQQAVNKSKTIEELLRFTKIPTTRLLKNSETGCSSVISPLKQYIMSPSLRHGGLNLSKKLCL